MNITVTCICGHSDEYTAFETSINGVWKCPVCKTERDTRKNYIINEHFMDLMAERAEIKEANYGT